MASRFARMLFRAVAAAEDAGDDAGAAAGDAAAGAESLVEEPPEAVRTAREDEAAEEDDPPLLLRDAGAARLEGDALFGRGGGAGRAGRASMRPLLMKPFAPKLRGAQGREDSAGEMRF